MWEITDLDFCFPKHTWMWETWYVEGPLCSKSESGNRTSWAAFFIYLTKRWNGCWQGTLTFMILQRYEIQISLYLSHFCSSAWHVSNPHTHPKHQKNSRLILLTLKIFKIQLHVIVAHTTRRLVNSPSVSTRTPTVRTAGLTTQALQKTPDRKWPDVPHPSPTGREPHAEMTTARDRAWCRFESWA